jgi:hypothetical protein
MPPHAIGVSTPAASRITIWPTAVTRVASQLHELAYRALRRVAGIFTEMRGPALLASNTCRYLPARTFAIRAAGWPLAAATAWGSSASIILVDGTSEHAANELPALQRPAMQIAFT